MIVQSSYVSLARPGACQNRLHAHVEDAEVSISIVVYSALNVLIHDLHEFDRYFCDYCDTHLTHDSVS